MSIVAVDGFCGSGWGVACRALGIEEKGIDNMPEVQATRAANGMETIFGDIWMGLDGRAGLPTHQLQIMSPPCQSFSMAGRGAGREAFDDVLRLIREGVYRRPLEMEALTQQAGFDDRTALVLTPLAYAIAHMPYFIAWEQVPTVLPVWEACAEILREAGYSVWTGYLQAEQYGVPQTRKRAILMASLMGEAKPPTPTHSRYYSRSPEKLDPGVLPWVSMAQALGWGMTSRPYPTVATGSTTAGGGTDPAALGGSGARRNVYTERSEGRWAPSGDADNDGGILRLQPADAAEIQSFPIDRELLAEQVRAVVNDQSGTPYDPTWPAGRPALTIAGRGLVPHPGATANRYNGSTKSRNDGIEITEHQAAILQSFPEGFEFKGGRSKVFLQVGNAVPPLLGRAVLSSLIN